MNIRENLKNNIDALRKLAFNEVVEEVAEPTAEATEETTETSTEETTETTETEKENFVDAQLADGTIVNIEPDIELGASVAVVTEDGIVPAPDAEHELASGEKIVTVGGVITEIIPSEEEVAEEEAAEDLLLLLKVVLLSLSDSFQAGIQVEINQETNFAAAAANAEFLGTLNII